MPASSVEILQHEHGRRIAVHRLAHGDTGRTLVLCHIAPGSAQFNPEPQQTFARGVTLLAVDRPGYGQSDPIPRHEWASVGAAADDLAFVINRTAQQPVGVVGWSAGGRVALALAARHPQLVDRVVVIGTPAPNEHIPWIAPAQLEVLESLRGQTPDVVHAALEAQFAPFTPPSTRAADALSLLGVSQADDAVLSQAGVREQLILMLEAAFTQGAAGLASDLAGYTLQPWGFEAHAVQAKTLLLYGSRDPVAGPKHGKWWQKNLPRARLEVVPDAGHVLIVAMWHRVLSHLAPHTNRQRNQPTA